MIQLRHLSSAFLPGQALQGSSNASPGGFRPSPAVSCVPLLCQQPHSPPSLKRQREESAKASYLTERSKRRAAEMSEDGWARKENDMQFSVEKEKIGEKEKRLKNSFYRSKSTGCVRLPALGEAV